MNIKAIVQNMLKIGVLEQQTKSLKSANEEVLFLRILKAGSLQLYKQVL